MRDSWLTASAIQCGKVARATASSPTSWEGIRRDALSW